MRVIRPSIACALVFFALFSCTPDASPLLTEQRSSTLSEAPAPLAVPDIVLGASLFAEYCADCHGQDGRGDGPRVPELEGPRPRDFHDTKMMAAMSPARAYLAITNGVSRTAMAGFDTIGADERWHLAFYSLSLGYKQTVAENAKDWVRENTDTSIRTLAELANRDIVKSFDAKIPPPSTTNSDEVLAYQRLIAPFHTAATALSPLRTSMAKVIAQYRKGEHVASASLLRTAYLNTFLAHLKLLRLRDPALANTTEQELRTLQSLLETSTPIREIQVQAQLVAQHLERGDRTLDIEISWGQAIAECASTTLSFAFDGAMLLFLLLVITTRRGADRKEKQVVHSSILTGIAASFLCWIAWPLVDGLLPGSFRTGLNATFSTAMVCLSLVLLIRLVQHFRAPPQIRTRAVPSWLVLLAVLGAGAIFRDAMEIVPTIRIIGFYHWGAFVGVLGAAVILAVMVRLLVLIEQRLPIVPRTSLLAITTIAMAVISAGGAARAAQDLGWLHASSAGVRNSPIFSFWPTSQGLLFQMLVALSCTAILTILTRRPVTERDNNAQ